ncbi:hypothetical protein GCM10023093_30770 [Nemorincola caseinilytica]|uniref:Lipid A deacylase LpxR family protein n=1 Tax=Nemorincola caseinilytica TaxID=2054315 RepID=A0ABP8NSH0_9BACT
MRAILSGGMFAILLCRPLFAQGQGIDNLSADRHINSHRYFRLSYDNDFFAARDQYYTQGFDMEVVSPALGHSFLRRILVHPLLSDTRYGIGFQHNAYTPSSISSDDILYGDQPFAGVAMLKAFAIAIDRQWPQRVSTSVHAGVIGPAAKAAQMQTYIHEQLDNLIPHGWQHQLQNDLVLNYGILYERQLWAYGRYLMLSGNARAHAGTLNSSLGAGLTLMAGYFSSPFRSGSADTRFSVYGYAAPVGSFCAYDATLQGGMFRHTGAYTIVTENVSRLLFRSRMGLVVSFGGIYLEYFTAFSTRRFSTGSDFRYGGIQLGVSL